jgi:hypothetical protein
LEDEKAQRILALTLENTTKATAAQIAEVEKYITKTSLAVGVTDDQLRPAFSRLVRSTKDVEEAQKLLSLANIKIILPTLKFLAIRWPGTKWLSMPMGLFCPATC